MIKAETPQRQLVRLVYASRFVGAQRDFGETLQSIIAKSIQNNRLDDVTGFLLAGEGRFLQLLEGPAERVEQTYARIGQDARHDDLVLISAGPAEHRLFRDWNMGQHHLGATDRASLAKIGLETFEPARLSADTALRLFAEVGGRHRR